MCHWLRISWGECGIGVPVRISRRGVRRAMRWRHLDVLEGPRQKCASSTINMWGLKRVTASTIMSAIVREPFRARELKVSKLAIANTKRGVRRPPGPRLRVETGSHGVAALRATTCALFRLIRIAVSMPKAFRRSAFSLRRPVRISAQIDTSGCPKVRACCCQESRTTFGHTISARHSP